MEKYDFSALAGGRGVGAVGEGGWPFCFVSAGTSKIKRRGGVALRPKKGRKGSKTADSIVNENERIQRDVDLPPHICFFEHFRGLGF